MRKSKPKTKRPAKRKGTRGSLNAPPTNAWPKGVSGNPEGRPRTDPELVEAFREMTPKALATLNQVMDDYATTALSPKGDPLVPAQAAVKAAEVALNRGWGTAPATIKLDVKGAVALQADVQHTIAARPDPSRLARVAAVLQKAGVLDALNAAAQPVLEAVPEELPEESADVRTEETPS